LQPRCRGYEEAGRLHRLRFSCQRCKANLSEGKYLRVFPLSPFKKAGEFVIVILRLNDENEP
ncbi:MAG: hypothetical protein Q4F40_10865, partial [Akkermansia sp.]|nr:hypothetical protein [Akkermansia sp.]